MPIPNNSLNEKSSILIVEDSPTQAEQLKFLLEEQGYTTSQAKDGIEALEILTTSQPSLIISDILMPRMDGFELCKSIKSDDNLKNMPVMLLTSLTDPEDVIKGLVSGADNFVTKPYSEKVLLSQIQYILVNKKIRNSQIAEMGIDIYFGGKKHLITSSRLQIIDLLLSTYENAIQKKHEVEQALTELTITQDELKVLNEKLEEKVLERTRRIEQLNEILHVIRNINQLIVKTEDRNDLIQHTCEVFTESKLFSSAWIALLDREGKIITVVDSGYEDSFEPLRADLIKGKLPDCARQALSKNEIIINKAPFLSCPDCPLSEKKINKVTLSVSLRSGGSTFGVLNISMGIDEPDKEAIALFEEAADDLGYALNTLDVQNQRKQTEAALLESEEHFRSLVTSASDVITMTDLEGNILFINEAGKTLHGVDNLNALIGRNAFSIIAEESQESAREGMEIVLKEGMSKNREYVLVRDDGKKVPVEMTISVIGDVNGKPFRFMAITRDITARKKIEEELKSAHEYARNLIDSSLDMIIAIDKKRRIVEFNKAAQETFGYKKDEVIGKDIEILFANPAESRKIYNTIRRTGRFSGEMRKKRKNGEVFTTFLSGSLLRDASGELLGIMSVSRDITKIKQSEKEKESLQMQLLQSQKMEAIGTLASGIAHDFNNLLTIILGHSQLASARLDEGDPTHKDLEKIKGASERAAILTRQLLIFSRKQVLETKVLNLNVMVTDTSKLLKRLIGEDIKIIPELETGLYQIKADQNQIEQILMNLVVNARDSIPKGGTILIKTQNVILDKDICKIIPESLPGKFVRLTVEDSGTGMDDEVIKHLFEPFFTTKKDGTGLGLAVVYGIAKQHNGWINVYSEPGHGSTFKVYFPAFFAAPEEEVEKIVSAESLQGNGERILVVEDEEYVRQFASAALREYGYIVFEVTCGKDAQRIFENETGNFDLIFSDVVLPDKDGLQLVDELLKVKPDLRVLLSSGYSDYKSQWDEIKNRSILFLQKPYGITDLLKSVKNLMQSREQ